MPRPAGHLLLVVSDGSQRVERRLCEPEANPDIPRDFVEVTDADEGTGQVVQVCPDFIERGQIGAEDAGDIHPCGVTLGLGELKVFGIELHTRDPSLAHDLSHIDTQLTQRPERGAADHEHEGHKAEHAPEQFRVRDPVSDALTQWAFFDLHDHSACTLPAPASRALVARPIHGLGTGFGSVFTHMK